MNKLISSVALSAALLSTSAFAVPMYDGDTAGSLTNSDLNTAGYYIWNDEDNSNNWHIRWTGIGADHDPVSWFGSVIFTDSNLNDAVEYQFETGGLYGDRLYEYYDYPFGGVGGGDAVYFHASTNNDGGIDGIDFYLDSGIDLLSFSLGSSIFDLSMDDVGTEQVAENIYIGDLLNNTEALVTYGTIGGYRYKFDIAAVPEPSSIALLGLGLLGLGAARRKAKKAS